MKLVTPLSQAQIDAADRLHRRLRQWDVSDRALRVLATALPEFSPEATLLKVVAVNQLYGTNVYAVVRMAEHVAQVMAARDSIAGDVELVERIAALPKAAGQVRQRKHTSFASKFAHFFVDAERFPIYDYYADEMVAYHMGRRNMIKDAEHPYHAFMQNLRALHERAGLSCTFKQLDRYLWLAGIYRAWRKDLKAPINAEAAALFATPDHELWTDLEMIGM